MNIWVVNQYAITPAQAGPTRHYDLARELVGRGHSVTVIASSFDHFVHSEARLNQGEHFRIENTEGIDFLWVRTPPYENNGVRRMVNMAHFAFSICLRRKMLRGAKPDVVIGSSPSMFAALAAERLASRYRVPFVMEVRDLWPQSLVDLGKVSRKHPLVKTLEMLESYLYRRASHIVSLLPHARDYMSKRGADRDVVSCIPNGVKLEPCVSVGRGDSKVLTALYAGAHGTANDLDSVLDAAALLQNEGWQERIHILLVGNGPQKARLQARAVNEGLSLVEFRDQVPKKEIWKVMAEADVLVMTLRNASLYAFGISPNKLYHYMAAARPLIFASESSNNPVEEAKCGITVPAENPVQLADALKRVASLSPEERMEMGRNGRSYIEKHHDVEMLAVKLEKILLNLTTVAPLGQAVFTEAQ